MSNQHYVYNGVQETGIEGVFEYRGATIALGESAFVIMRNGVSTSHEYLKRSKSIEARLSDAKDAVLWQIDQGHQQAQNAEYRKAMNELEELWRESDREGFASSIFRDGGDFYRYGDVVIRISRGDYPEDCPWDDWDAEPIALCEAQTQFGSGWSHTYGNHSKDFSVTSLYRYPSRDEVVRWINIFHGGVAMEFNTDSNQYIGVFTAGDVAKHFEGDRNAARKSLAGSIEVFREWADVGPTSITIYTRDGEVAECLSSIYEGENYHFAPYAVTEGFEMAKMVQEDIDEEDIEAYEEMESEVGGMMARSIEMASLMRGERHSVRWGESV